MAEQTQLRPTGRDEFDWYVVGLENTRVNLWCGNCAARIPVGETHARCADTGERLCGDCVEASERGPTLPANEANRRQRHEKIQRARDGAVRSLLDGLEVESIRELRRLVLLAREVEDGVDRLTGARYEQMNPMTGPISCVYVALRPGTSAAEVNAVIEEEASAWARHAVARMRRLLEGASDGT